MGLPHQWFLHIRSIGNYRTESSFLAKHFIFFMKNNKMRPQIFTHRDATPPCITITTIFRGNSMKLILLGAPGAGKGTVAKLLTKMDGSVQISTGDILRGAVAAGTELGKKAEAAMKAGDLVSDDLIMGIMEERLKEDDCKAGYLLDGFPRTIPQAEALKVLLEKMGEKLDFAVEIDVPREVILDRLTTRRTCEDCGEIYNVKSNPPKVEGVCDKCGGAVVQRADETEEAISNRLNVYNDQTAPLVDFYRNEGMLLSVNATSSDDVIDAIRAKLGN
jgi:adenylate kinase